MSSRGRGHRQQQQRLNNFEVDHLVTPVMLKRSSEDTSNANNGEGDFKTLLHSSSLEEFSRVKLAYLQVVFKWTRVQWIFMSPISCFQGSTNNSKVDDSTLIEGRGRRGGQTSAELQVEWPDSDNFYTNHTRSSDKTLTKSGFCHQILYKFNQIWFQDNYRNRSLWNLQEDQQDPSWIPLHQMINAHKL